MPELPSTTGCEAAGINRRILVVDDDPAIHEDFRKIFALAVGSRAALQQAEEALFGPADRPAPALQPRFTLDFAAQGSQGAALVERARRQSQPYALAFVDVRMPPGWDGIETTARIWQLDPAIQIVICTAYSDHSWQDILARLGRSDRLLILKKPFDITEVLQLASTLTEKWQRTEAANNRIRELERLLERAARSG